ncbi:hypothetical protein RSOLAG22IIIB_12538 [Rhizoctonia solani]|uniref:Glycoside hydrolase 131 catalytic N-terminal domain-containing protein n=1 Tax=Rhizoctonia solani TaxID=456999 RepID=A0A0K6GEP6_9AGAM|nr:hypothetical protein RSOLAG22IIIB_12538 [Rhizoctonia solani]
MLSFHLALVFSCAAAALADSIPALYDGRAPLNYTAADIDAPKVPYVYVVKGSEAASKYVTFTNKPPSTPLWFNKANSSIEQTISVKIDNSSEFVPGNNPANSQWGFRRTEILGENNRTMLQTGKTVWHFSIMPNEEHPLNLTHEYQLTFIEPSDGVHVFSVRIGSPFTIPTAPKLPTETAGSLRVLNHALETLYTTPFDAETWHNFAIQVDWDTRTLGVFASKGGDKLTKVSDLVPNDSTKPVPEGRGEFHFGLLKV